ncbi:NAD-dependent succinate-semialdehyde dehydrogenase [Antarcticibacterium flavum]|uniref:NAD-dependent succinate-semialdehyde dehydrogenase n=1 Tax=Antarcticibacterium flavum TaxID=2058175 RepID=A0A5B7X8S0_9FLAO|nr:MULTISPECIES: NAD-dependent succinate-semialdehyde dehydrogenase [Antarcticibacterium]MCM4159230.1 succinate-semialdehyde dehydrogenase [Antarcticibacterium sp. W02-3]QCY71053.1 NAD-dependent succinate-semialdehyde dehydrogenase [Antarcticibacterium flavum]
MSEAGTREAIETINPATGKTLDRYDYMTNEEVKAAISKCQKAFEKWRDVSPEDRAEVIKGIGKALTKAKTELAQLMTDEMGKTLEQSKQEVDLCVAICEYTAEIGPKELKTEERNMVNGQKGRVSYAPIGIVYGIQPWNYPCYQVVRYSIASLMAGNGVLLKHASNVTGSGKLLERIYNEAEIPDGLFTTLMINHDQSDEVIKNKLVRGVTLTGSPDAGRNIGQKATAELKKTVLELGANDAYLVFEDADIDIAVEECVKGRIYNNGETCIAAKRFIVTEKVYEEFREKFVKTMSEVKMGDPNKESTQLGPLARKDLRDDLHEQVVKSVEKGARIACGGEIPDGEGFFYPATVLENVQPGQPAYEDELFGPVASLIKARDNEDAMRIANDSRFGLGGGIFSKDEDAAFEIAEKHFDTGMVFINSFGLADPAIPFGGVKNSGYGREHGGFGLKEFVNIKGIMKR